MPLHYNPVFNMTMNPISSAKPRNIVVALVRCEIVTKASGASRSPDGSVLIQFEVIIRQGEYFYHFKQQMYLRVSIKFIWRSTESRNSLECSSYQCIRYHDLKTSCSTYWYRISSCSKNMYIIKR